MKLGNAEDIRSALDLLFPGKEAYTDDNQVAFGVDDEGRTRATIEVRKPHRWTVTKFNDDGTKEIVEQAVPSARP